MMKKKPGTIRVKARRIPRMNKDVNLVYPVRELHNYLADSAQLVDGLGLPEPILKKARPKAAHVMRLMDATLLGSIKESIPINSGKTIVRVFGKELPSFMNRNVLSAQEQASLKRMQEMLGIYLGEMNRWEPGSPVAFPKEFLDWAVRVHMNELKAFLGDKFDSFNGQVGRIRVNWYK